MNSIDRNTASDIPTTDNVEVFINKIDLDWDCLIINIGQDYKSSQLRDYLDMVSVIDSYTRHYPLNYSWKYQFAYS